MITPIVVETFETEKQAIKAMHRYATNLRRLKKTGRYGVYVEKHRGSYWLILNDRGPERGSIALK